MEKILKDVPLFVEVCKQKSFSKAAENLDIPVSTLSRRIAGLEREMGLALLYRSSRKVQPTESGKIFFERCSFIVSEAALARDEVTGHMKKASGRLRLSMPSHIYHGYFARLICDFAQRWPEIHLNVQLSQRWVDLESEPFDLDIRPGPLPDSNLRARKLFTLCPVPYASPKLLALYPNPQKPRDIASLPCITLVQQGDAWELTQGSKRERVPIKPVHTVNDPIVARNMALAGIGVALLIPAEATYHEKQGELIRLLPGWRYENVDLHVVMAGRVPYRARLFIDFAADYFARLPE